MRLFARRQNACMSPRPCLDSAPSRAMDRAGLRARRRVRPEGEMLDSRLLMASGGPGAAGATASPDLDNRVAQALQPYFAQDQFPGISVAVVTDGKVAMAQGYGTADVANGSAVQADTRFDIGSVTKTFTALGVLLLYQESQGTASPLNLDAPISEYLHNTRSFKMPRKWSNITTRELLDMTSGINNIGSVQPWPAQIAAIAKEPPSLHARDGIVLQQHKLLLARRAHRATDRGKLWRLHPRSDSDAACNVRDRRARPVRNGPESGGWLQPVTEWEVDEGRGAQRTVNVRRRRDGLDRPGHGHLYDSAPERRSARSRDLRLDVDLDTDAAICCKSRRERAARPRMGYSDRHERGAHRGDQGGQVPGYTSELILFPTTDSGVFVSFNTLNPKGVTGLQVAEAVYAAEQSDSGT